jgi:anaerobic selenocysteine-containing dehydrogenase
MTEPAVDTSPKTWDQVKTTTCYMCACRCGIKVYLKDGTVKYIDGNRDHPVNKGVICGKGASGIMQHYSPARLSKPLLRVGERGSGDFREIEWEEALSIAAERLGRVRATDPKKLAFFTGRDQSQSLTGWWAQQFGTPNFAAHGGFCSVNMAAAGLYTFGGSFWEFGEPDWKHTKYFLLFGVAEDHASNPLKTGLGKLKGRGAKIVSVNPVRTGYSAIADEWIGIRPGTDGLFAAALIHELLAAQKIDAEYLLRYTNAPWLVIENPGGADDGLFARNEQDATLVWDAHSETPMPALSPDALPKLMGRFKLPDGRRAVTSFQLIAERFLSPDHAPEAVEERCGVPATTIRRIAAELAHTAFEEQIELDIPWTDYAGRPMKKCWAVHACHARHSAHANGFTCLIHLLQIIRHQRAVLPPAPFEARTSWRSTGHGQVKQHAAVACRLLRRHPEDLLVDDTLQRIDKAYSWEALMAAHGPCMVRHQAHPYVSMSSSYANMS